MLIAKTRKFGFQNVFAHAVFVFQNVFSKRKATKGVKRLVLTTTLSAEWTLHAIRKNYVIKIIPAGKILERNLLDCYKKVFNLKTFKYLFKAWFLVRVTTLVHKKKSVIRSANRDYIKVFHSTKI